VGHPGFRTPNKGGVMLKMMSLLLSVAAAAGLCGVAYAQSKAAPGDDLTGVYYTLHPDETLKTIDGKPIPLTAAGRAALAANAPGVAASKIPPAGVAFDACVPFGPTRILQQPYPLEIVQKGDEVLLIWEHNHVWERIYMNEKPNPDVDPSYMGFSVGHWDGKTLVIDSANFNAKTFLDDNGLPHTEDLKLQRRLHKAKGGKALDIEVTVTDPTLYTRPWTIQATLPLRPDISTEEYVCGVRTLETRYTRAQ
jgi:hypothetical protein